MPRLDDSLSVLLKKIIKYMMLLARGGGGLKVLPPTYLQLLFSKGQFNLPVRFMT